CRPCAGRDSIRWRRCVMSKGIHIPADIFAMSTRAIVGNKLRSSLTLLGIVAGIASIIAVMTAISVMQSAMEKEMSVLGTQVFQVQKFPAGFSSDQDRRKAMKRPPLTIENASAIREQVTSIDLVGCELGLRLQGRIQRGGDQSQPLYR